MHLSNRSEFDSTSIKEVTPMTTFFEEKQPVLLKIFTAITETHRNTFNFHITNHSAGGICITKKKALSQIVIFPHIRKKATHMTIALAVQRERTVDKKTRYSEPIESLEVALHPSIKEDHKLLKEQLEKILLGMLRTYFT